jgi:hypothetical protein
MDLRNRGQSGAAKSGAAERSTDSQGDANDPDLARVIAAWPTLPGDVKAEVMKQVDGAAR